MDDGQKKILEAIQDLKSQVDNLTSRQEDFSLQQKELISRQEEFSLEQKNLSSRQEEFSLEQKNLSSRQEEFSLQQEKLTSHQEEFSLQQDNISSQQKENTDILRALEHKAEVHSAQLDNLEHSVAHLIGNQKEIKDDVKLIKNELNLISIKSAQNSMEIAAMKETS